MEDGRAGGAFRMLCGLGVEVGDVFRVGVDDEGGVVGMNLMVAEVGLFDGLVVWVSGGGLTEADLALIGGLLLILDGVVGAMSWSGFAGAGRTCLGLLLLELLAHLLLILLMRPYVYRILVSLVEHLAACRHRRRVVEVAFPHDCFGCHLSWSEVPLQICAPGPPEPRARRSKGKESTGMWDEFRAAEVLTDETLLCSVDEDIEAVLGLAPLYALNAVFISVSPGTKIARDGSEGGAAGILLELELDILLK